MWLLVIFFSVEPFLGPQTLCSGSKMKKNVASWVFCLVFSMILQCGLWNFLSFEFGKISKILQARAIERHIDLFLRISFEKQPVSGIQNEKVNHFYQWKSLKSCIPMFILGYFEENLVILGVNFWWLRYLKSYFKFFIMNHIHFQHLQTI